MKVPQKNREDSGRQEVIRVEDLNFSFGNRPVLKDINFSVYDGETLVVMGESGCGKTTLLRILIGLLRAGKNRVHILGRNLSDMDEDALDEFRTRIGMLFQFGALINSLTIGENIMLALQRHRHLQGALAERVARLKLSLVGLDEVFDLLPSELSGGMKKRAGLARALMLDPKLLFFDEPTSGLDPNTAAGMDQLVLALKELLGPTMVVVTHDLQTAFTIGDRFIMLHEGRMIAQGDEAALRASEDRDVIRFLGRHGPDQDLTPDLRLTALFSEDP
ncbi:MAG: ATP-binding cassette domain-containing protein [Planctomycetes bacterium]|nr:ATP-binding cassette domain-containing protein [Planctomycetota bacterium]